MAWFMLIVAGLLETGWAIGIKYTEGFTKPWPSVVTIVLMIASFWLLAQATRTIPIGTAYVVWVGIGGFGAGVLGIALFGEPATPLRMFFLAMMIASVVGLKLTSPG